MAHEDPKLAEEAQTASRICGATITSSFDWSSFVAANKVEDMNGAFRNPLSNMCSVPLLVLQSMCQDPAPIQRSQHAGGTGYEQRQTGPG
jgi:hypothetical protein